MFTSGLEPGAMATSNGLIMAREGKPDGSNLVLPMRFFIDGRLGWNRIENENENENIKPPWGLSLDKPQDGFMWEINSAYSETVAA